MHNLRSALLSAAILGLATAPGQAEVISYNWDFNGTIPSDAASFAGLESAACWNNSYPEYPAPPLVGNPKVYLIDNSGATTTMDIYFSSTGQRDNARLPESVE